MASLRAYLQAALTVLGVLLAGFGASIAATIDVPPGGGDIPTGFAIMFAWALVAIGVAVFALGATLLDETGLGAYVSRRQRLAIRIGGACLLLAAVAPFLAIAAFPLYTGAMHPPPSGEQALLSNLIMAWLGLVALGGTGIAGGILWRVGEAAVALVRGYRTT